ncbi:M20 family metallopeptidase [Natrarchaeobaculum sulfurireducens]|uniref:Acetylornithine deacetylase/Succinyl-diaminopimelate desuccinylase or related deacylase n=1 Tax=Natrarchaeobaculum sulfurireducens TaxID=2044521 RepID=A0A346PAI1_9EURY|nr:M20/M25/M40 family metallo-hydrolase [Natrarchaeobaculum sulfurireducens]AXR76526.1 Acetylornithine deacetylase/Succinyl-diaminopimelate desuccinylase or related deacylase [Natrarchaeobaculum sulfurireducens]
MTETLIELATRLAAVSSHEDETAAGDEIEAWLCAETDADVRRDEVGNVIARNGAGERSLALVGHHDVVAPADEQVTDDGNYIVEACDGRLYGRGTADMKGAVAAAMLAFRDIDVAGTSSERTSSDDASLPGELVFASFVGEEVGGVGARHAIDEGFSPDYAIVGEGSTGYSSPGVTDVAVAHKGRRGSTITAHGSAAHASEPDAGENAIYRATDAVSLIRTLEAPTVEVAGESLEGSVVVTEIDGGTAMNVVPDRCDVTVDERTVPGERAAIERLEDLEGVEWTVDQDLPPMRCGDEAFAGGVLQTADSVQSGSPEFVTKPHATDAGWLAAAGTECVICGPAEPGEAHTADESVSVAVLERCYRIYRGAAENWLG